MKYENINDKMLWILYLITMLIILILVIVACSSELSSQLEAQRTYNPYDKYYANVG